MEKQELIDGIKNLEELRIRLEDSIYQVLDALEYNFVSMNMVLNLNNAIYDFYEEGMQTVREICQFHKNEW